MKVFPWRAAAILLLNLALSLAIRALAPTFPVHTDLREYEYAGRHGFAPGCPWSIYCYRVLVPVALEHLPGNPETRWRGYDVVATTAAGTVTALMTMAMAGSTWPGVLASVLAQSGYGFAFTAYDPYTSDQFVFLVAAVLAWCWVEDRWLVAVVAGLVGVFAKETVALVSASCLIAALARDRPTWRAWVASGVLVGATLLTFHVVMDTWFGWSIRANPAARFSSGSWLALWWRNNPFLDRKLFLLFAPFGFGWIFAALAYRTADLRLRQLALGAIVPFLLLCYVETPERALANAFFVVVPLAALYLARVRLELGLAMAVVNGLITAKVGTSTTSLPSSTSMLVVALPLAAWVVFSSVTPSAAYSPSR